MTTDIDAMKMMKYVPTVGVYSCERLDLFAGLWDDAGTLKALAIGAAGTVGFKYMTGGTNGTDKIAGLVWGATSDNTDKWVKDWQVPTTWKKGSKILVAAKVRKLDTTGSATDNTDLAMKLEASLHNSSFSTDENEENDGDTEFSNLGTLATPVPVVGTLLDGTAVLPVKAGAGSEEAFRWMFFEVTDGMTAAQLAALKPGATVTFKLYPNEAVGTALNIEVMAIEVLCKVHEVPANRFEKNRVNG